MSKLFDIEPDHYKIPPPPQSCTDCGCDTTGKNNSVCQLSLVDTRTGSARMKPAGMFGPTYHHDRNGTLIGLTPPVGMEFDRWVNRCVTCYDAKHIDKYAEKKRAVIAREGMTRIPGETAREYAERCRKYVLKNAMKIGARI